MLNKMEKLIADIVARHHVLCVAVDAIVANLKGGKQ